MNQDSETEWTAWRIWLHPRRALDAFAEAAEQINELERSLDDVSKTLEEHGKECESLSLRLKASREETESLANKLESTRRELQETKDMIKEQEEVDREMMEFDAKLSKVVDMKRSYEKRIAELEYRLQDVWMKNRQPVSDLLDPTDPESLPVTSDEQIDMTVPPADEVTPTDLRMEDAVRPAPRIDTESNPAHRLKPPAHAESADPDGDWLLTLPDL